MLRHRRTFYDYSAISFHQPTSITILLLRTRILVLRTEYLVDSSNYKVGKTIIETQIASVYSPWEGEPFHLSWRITLQTIVDCQIQTTKTDQLSSSILSTSGESSVYWVSFVLKHGMLKRWAEKINRRTWSAQI